MIVSSYKCGVILYDWVNRGSEKDYLKELTRKQKAMATRMACEMIVEIIPQLVFQLIFNRQREEFSERRIGTVQQIKIDAVIDEDGKADDFLNVANFRRQFVPRAVLASQIRPHIQNRNAIIVAGVWVDGAVHDLTLPLMPGPFDQF